MTLNDIIVSALAQLDRPHDAATVEIYRSRLAQFANDAQDDLAQSLHLTRTEAFKAPNGIIDLESLSRGVIRIEEIRQYGAPVPYQRGSTPNLIMLPYRVPAEVVYRFSPKRLVHGGDECELDAYLHPLIVSYVVGRERMGGDVSTQRGANIYLSMYSAAKARLRGYLKDSGSFSIVNRY